MEWLYLPNSRADVSRNVMLIKSAEKYILIDAGSGNHADNPLEGWLLENLASVGISPEMISEAVIMHAHRDHIGGLVSKDGTLIFTNAGITSPDENMIFGLLKTPIFPDVNSKERRSNSKNMSIFLPMS